MSEEDVEAGGLDAALRSAAECCGEGCASAKSTALPNQDSSTKGWPVTSRCGAAGLSEGGPVPPPGSPHSSGHRALTSTAQYPPGPIANPMDKNRWARILITADSHVVFWALSIPILSAVLV